MNSDRTKAREWDRATVEAALAAHDGNLTRASATLGVPRSTLQNYVLREGIELERSARPLQAVPEQDGFADEVHGLIRKRKQVSIEDLADKMDVPPRRVREALDDLRRRGYRLPEERGEVELQQVPPTKTRAVHKSLLDGDEVTFGVVSDTHLSSKECALEHLHLAYDHLEERGIAEVLHPGDIVAGRGIYRTQDQDLVHHTFEAQVNNAVENYPKRDGIKTLLIGGNHDLTGDFGRMGADPCAAIAHRRPDISYIGAYSGYVEMPNGAHVQMVHGAGGGSYAVSYKPQKYVEGLPPGRKPAMILFGHWHISGFFRHRGVPLLLAGCFEWQTSLLVRLGLQPDVGFWIVTLRLGDDGSVLKVTPEWTGFYEGRVVKAAA